MSFGVESCGQLSCRIPSMLISYGLSARWGLKCSCNFGLEFSYCADSGVYEAET